MSEIRHDGQHLPVRLMRWVVRASSVVPMWVSSAARTRTSRRRRT